MFVLRSEALIGKCVNTKPAFKHCLMFSPSLFCLGVMLLPGTSVHFPGICTTGMEMAKLGGQRLCKIPLLVISRESMHEAILTQAFA